MYITWMNVLSWKYLLLTVLIVVVGVWILTVVVTKKYGYTPEREKELEKKSEEHTLNKRMEEEK